MWRGTVSYCSSHCTWFRVDDSLCQLLNLESGKSVSKADMENFSRKALGVTSEEVVE